ncbi:MAG: hypothetical protein KDD99_22155 [Bacteroidetes bacterium]|nr:hypothetical protein [Bacteroidota bacterium]
MHRRNFLSLTGTTTLGLSLLPMIKNHSFILPEDNPQAFLEALIKENDLIIPELLKTQNTIPYARGLGGITNQYDIETPGGTAGFIQRLTAAFVSPSSTYFQSEDLLDRMQKAVDYLNKVQYSDGTIDLYSTNFHSPPDTGFVVEPLCISYGLLSRIKKPSEKLIIFLNRMSVFLKKAGEALRVGGIHTPNHRWVVSMALARIHTLFPDSRYVDRVEQWLNEKIDIDPDGQYTEKSTHIYSPLTNRCLITIARLLDKPELYAPVSKNLEMTLYYMHPNGEIATEASGRQDKYQTGTLLNYYYSYRYMALKEKNGQFAAMDSHIRSLIANRELSRFLPYFLEDDFLMKSLPKTSALPDVYRRNFSHSNLIRIRNKETDATILADNPTFFTYQKGEAVLQGMRLATAFFGKGQFVSLPIKEEGETMILTQELTGPYYQPFPVEELPDDGDWEKMPRSKRPQSEVQELAVRIEIRPHNVRGFKVKVTINGSRYVPVALEMGFRPGGILTGMRTVPGIENAYILQGSEGRYQYGNDEIIFGPGNRHHTWTQLRGALPKLDAESVYITYYAPCQFEVIIR